MRPAPIGPIAIDIGSRGIKFMQIEHGSDRPVVVAAAWRPLPLGLTDTGRLDAAFSAIESLTQTRMFSGRRPTGNSRLFEPRPHRTRPGVRPEDRSVPTKGLHTCVKRARQRTWPWTCPRVVSQRPVRCQADDGSR